MLQANQPHYWLRPSLAEVYRLAALVARQSAPAWVGAEEDDDGRQRITVGDVQIIDSDTEGRFSAFFQKKDPDGTAVIVPVIQKASAAEVVVEAFSASVKAKARSVIADDEARQRIEARTAAPPRGWPRRPD